MADDPALFREDVEEHAVGQLKPRRGAILKADPEIGHITAGMSPEQGEGLPVDLKMERNQFPQTARRWGPAALPAVHGLANR
jgi:hypothetical protein